MAWKQNNPGCPCCAECDCCISQIYVCVCGMSYRVILCSSVEKEFSVSACCDCGEDDGILYLNYICDTDPVSLTLEWTLICGEDEAGGSIDITDLCDGDTTIIDEVTAGDCTVTLSISDQELCCNSCLCCEDVPTTATVTLTNAILCGGSSLISPVHPGYDISGTYPLTFSGATVNAGTTDMHLFDDEIFVVGIVFSSLVRYAYVGMEVGYTCNAQTGEWGISVRFYYYATDPTPVAPEPPPTPYPLYASGAVFASTEFAGCVPRTYSPLTLTSVGTFFSHDIGGWEVGVELE